MTPPPWVRSPRPGLLVRLAAVAALFAYPPAWPVPGLHRREDTR